MEKIPLKKIAMPWKIHWIPDLESPGEGKEQLGHVQGIKKIASDISYEQYPKFISCSNNKIGWDVDGLELKVWAEKYKTFRGQQEKKNGIIARISSFWKESAEMRVCCNSLEFVPAVAQGLEGEIQSMGRQISSPCSGTQKVLLWSLKTTSVSFLLRQQLEKEDFWPKSLRLQRFTEQPLLCKYLQHLNIL